MRILMLRSEYSTVTEKRSLTILTVRVLIFLFQSLLKAFAAHAVEIRRTIESASSFAERSGRGRLRGVSLHVGVDMIRRKIPEKGTVRCNQTKNYLQISRNVSISSIV